MPGSTESKRTSRCLALARHNLSEPPHRPQRRRLPVHVKDRQRARLLGITSVSHRVLAPLSTCTKCIDHRAPHRASEKLNMDMNRPASRPCDEFGHSETWERWHVSRSGGTELTSTSTGKSRFLSNGNPCLSWSSRPKSCPRRYYYRRGDIFTRHQQARRKQMPIYLHWRQHTHSCANAVSTFHERKKNAQRTRTPPTH